MRLGNIVYLEGHVITSNSAQVPCRVVQFGGRSNMKTQTVCEVNSKNESIS